MIASLLVGERWVSPQTISRLSGTETPPSAPRRSPSASAKFREACVRCPMLRISLGQVPRLLEIEANTHERLAEARRMRWLGEVAALEESLHHIANKKQQAERLRERALAGEISVKALS